MATQPRIQENREKLETHLNQEKAGIKIRNICSTKFVIVRSRNFPKKIVEDNFASFVFIFHNNIKFWLNFSSLAKFYLRKKFNEKFM